MNSDEAAQHFQRQTGLDADGADVERDQLTFTLPRRPFWDSEHSNVCHVFRLSMP
jgi:hypothetical protein